MPDYASLSTQVDGFKSELTALYQSGQLTAQDMLFVAKAITEIGTVLGVNDIVAATAAEVASAVSTVQGTRDSSVTTVNSTKTAALADVETARAAAVTQLNNIVASLNGVDVSIVMGVF